MVKISQISQIQTANDIFIYLYINFILYFNQLHPPRCRRASCHDMSESRRPVKVKDMKKEIFPFMPLSCLLGHRRISNLQGFINLWHLPTKASRQGQGFIPRTTPHASLLTNHLHTLLSCPILLAWLTSRPLLSRYESTSSAAYPLSDYQHTPLHRPS